MHSDESFLTRFSAGVTGAVVLTVMHETIRQFVPDAPRMDVLGERALVKIFHLIRRPLPPKAERDRITLYGDVASNALIYSFVGSGKSARRRGIMIGLLAGFGALYLPEPLGLGKAPHSESQRNRKLTIAYYLIGGLVAGMVAHAGYEKAATNESAED